MRNSDLSREEFEVVARRILAKTARSNDKDCWVFQGTKARGYGVIKFKSRIRVTSRLLYEYFIGEVGDGLELDHLCRNRACVNYYHLEPVTHRVNLLRGDTLPAKYIMRSECKNGHAFDDENTAIVNGTRRCRACKREHMRNVRAARRERRSAIVIGHS